MSTQVARAPGRATRRLIAVGARGVVRTAPEISGPVPCPSCLGEGVLLRRPCRHMGVCPCDPDEIPCESCGGGDPDNPATPEGCVGHHSDCELAGAIAKAEGRSS